MRKITLCTLLALSLSAIKTSAQGQQAAVSFKMAQISLLVKDYDETVKFYTNSLGFVKTADLRMGDERWVTIAPPGQKGTELVLVKARTRQDTAAIGMQAGNRTLMVLETDRFDDVYKKYQDNKVNFIGEPATKPWGRQAELTDLYGNRLVLLELKAYR